MPVSWLVSLKTAKTYSRLPLLPPMTGLVFLFPQLPLQLLQLFTMPLHSLLHLSHTAFDLPLLVQKLLPREQQLWSSQGTKMQAFPTWN